MRRKNQKAPAECVMEVVTPRTNAALISPAEHVFAGLSVDSGMGSACPVALEITGDRDRARFLVRTAAPEHQRHVAAQLAAAYPQAEMRFTGSHEFPFGDPALLSPDEQVRVCTLRLRNSPCLPIRTFGDRDLDVRGGSAQADPLLGVLSAMSHLESGWRALVQLVVVGPAPKDWSREYQRLALEPPFRQDRTAGVGPSLLGPLSIVGLLALYAVASTVRTSWSRGEWPSVLGLIVATIAVIVLSIPVIRWLRSRDVVDPRMVQAKLSHDARRVELRAAVFAPGSTRESDLIAILDQLVAAYRAFDVPSGNSLTRRHLHPGAGDLRVLVPLASPNLLNVRELAGLWHLPQARDDVAFVERTTARRRLPLASAVASDAGGVGCRIGISAHQQHAIPVHLPPGLLRRHLIAVAKTRRGKSSLLLRLAHHLMVSRSDSSAKRCLVLVDPHRDLATAALALVPRSRLTDVVYLDLSNRRRPFGINLLDTCLGWDRDQATANALRIFRREFEGFWGPRMEDAFRFAVLALFEANQALCAEDPRFGRGAQHTVLDVPAMLARRGFRQQVLKRTQDPLVRQWFDGYFADLESRQRLEIINPVQTKVHKYLGSLVARQIVGQPRSTVDFRQLLAQRKIVIVNLNAFDVGEDVAALVGGTLLNLAARAVSAQAMLAPEDRQPVTLIVDEFHTLPGADYEQVFGELAKYGANMLLATQTLARLDRLTDAQRTRDLRAAVFSNLDGLFAFHTSAEDADYLAPELGGGLDAQDILELGHYQCYARITDTRTGERLPSFSVQLDPPPTGNRSQAEALAKASAELYGRDAIDVELDLQSALERIKGPRTGHGTTIPVEASNPGAANPNPNPNAGVPAEAGPILGSQLPKRARNRSRPSAKTPRSSNSSMSLKQQPLESWREPV